MKLSASIFVFGVGVTISALCAAPTQTITKETVLNAITEFRVDPTSGRGRAAAAVVLNFTEKSPDVVVKINPKTVPFLKKNGEPERGSLMAAFIVGNLDAQLLRGEKKDNPYAGELQVIETYRQLKKKNSKLRIPEVEKFIELEKRGELKAYVESR